MFLLTKKSIDDAEALKHIFGAEASSKTQEVRTPIFLCVDKNGEFYNKQVKDLNPTLRERIYKIIVQNIMKTKMKFGMGVSSNLKKS